MARNFVAASSQRMTCSFSSITAFPVTISVWCKPASVATSLVIGIELIGSDFPFIHIQTRSTGIIRYQFADNIGTEDRVQGGSYSVGSWVHIVGLSRASNDHELYINGTSIGTNSTSLGSITNLSNIVIGYDHPPAGPSIFFDGDIAEPAIWNVALSVDDVISLAKGFSSSLVRTSNLVSYWKLIGKADPEKDEFGMFNLSLVNSPIGIQHPRIIYPHKRKTYFLPQSLYIPYIRYPNIFNSKIIQGSS